MDIEKEIKKILIDEDMTATKLAECLDTSRQNLNSKFRNKDMMVSYFIKILDILGYELKIVKKEN